VVWCLRVYEVVLIVGRGVSLLLSLFFSTCVFQPSSVVVLLNPMGGSGNARRMGESAIPIFATVASQLEVIGMCFPVRVSVPLFHLLLPSFLFFVRVVSPLFLLSSGTLW
jgi:hypothetical protein